MPTSNREDGSDHPFSLRLANFHFLKSCSAVLGHSFNSYSQPFTIALFLCTSDRVIHNALFNIPHLSVSFDSLVLPKT